MTRRVALYARYSSDMQSDRSIDDQARLCREEAARLGGAIVETYCDYAISGSHLNSRPAMMQLLADAAEGRFDTVLAEALDRISRDQADAATIRKRLDYAGVALVTVNEGPIGALEIGLKGTMNQLFLEELGKKTRRGLAGVVEDGRAVSKPAYGYRPVRRLGEDGEAVRGLREVDPAEAAVVLRIFGEYAAGKAPLEIARGLNRDGIKGPSGKAWGVSTIAGSRKKGIGILNNELYVGKIVWNRQTWRKDPETGKRRSRMNPEKDWRRKDAPALRLVDQALWDRVKTVQEAAAREQAPRAKRAKYLLSGLMHCGCCGGTITTIYKDYVGCANNRDRGTCDNNRRMRRPLIEARVLEGLKRRLMEPERVKLFVRAYHAERDRLARTERTRGEDLRRDLAQTERRIDRYADAIGDGTDTPAIRAKLKQAEEDAARIRAAIAGLDEDDGIVAMHPNLAEIMAEKVEHLAKALTADDTLRLEATGILRSLIDDVILTPGDRPGDFHIEIVGELARAFRLAHSEEGRAADGGNPGGVSMVAGTGKRRYPPNESGLYRIAC